MAAKNRRLAGNSRFGDDRDVTSLGTPNRHWRASQPDPEDWLEGVLKRCSAALQRFDALFAARLGMRLLDSERVREGLKDVLLGPAQLYEALRQRAGQQLEP
jgi:hypothetical protein